MSSNFQEPKPGEILVFGHQCCGFAWNRAMPNQYKPLPPLDVIRPHLEAYYNLGLNDKKIAENLMDHYDIDKYGLGPKSVKRLRKKWGLLNTRQQKHTTESIAEKVSELRKMFPVRGNETIRKELRLRHNIRASRHVVAEYFRETEPDAVKARARRRFKRRRFHAAGVNDVWVQDQHNKWGPRFSLWLHNGLDPFTGVNNWLKVWWTNKNPRLIASYYIEAVRAYGAIPLTTQSDPGSENYGVTNIQTLARHELDPSLAGTLQHRWKHRKTNIKSEANWSMFRRDFAPGFEDLFESGVNQGWYDVDKPLENLIFRWLAVPWLQTELDRWVIHRNQTAGRSDRKKVLPHGVPELIRHKLEQFGTLDFKIPVSKELIDRLEAEFAPRDHEVFQLTPPAFHEQALAFYVGLGRPPVTFDTFWHVYRQLIQSFRAAGPDNILAPVLASHFDSVARVDNEEVPLIPGMKDLRQGDKVVGDVGDELDVVYASFTEDESDLQEMYASFTEEEDNAEVD